MTTAVDLGRKAPKQTKQTELHYLSVLSSFATILKRKRELDALLLLFYRCLAVVFVLNPSMLFSSPEPKALGELIGWNSSRRPSVRPCVRPFTLSNMNISETSCLIKIKFHLEHHWGRGLTAKGFGQDRIRTLVSMATDSFHRVIMGTIL